MINYEVYLKELVLVLSKYFALKHKKNKTEKFITNRVSFCNYKMRQFSKGMTVAALLQTENYFNMKRSGIGVRQ